MKKYKKKNKIFGRNNKKCLNFIPAMSVLGNIKENKTKEDGIKVAEKYKNLAQNSADFRSETRKNIARPKDQAAKLKTNKLKILLTILFFDFKRIKKPKHKNKKEQPKSR